MPKLRRGYWKWVIILSHMRSLLSIDNYVRNAHYILKISAPVQREQLHSRTKDPLTERHFRDRNAQPSLRPLPSLVLRDQPRQHRKERSQVTARLSARPKQAPRFRLDPRQRHGSPLSSPKFRSSQNTLSKAQLRICRPK